MTSLAFSGWNAADTWYIGKCLCITVALCKMQDQKSWTLHWCSFLEDSRNVVTSIVVLKDGQYIECGQISLNSPWIIQNARPHIVDAPLMLMSRMG